MCATQAKPSHTIWHCYLQLFAAHLIMVGRRFLTTIKERLGVSMAALGECTKNYYSVCWEVKFITRTPSLSTLNLKPTNNQWLKQSSATCNTLRSITQPNPNMCTEFTLMLRKGLLCYANGVRYCQQFKVSQTAFCSVAGHALETFLCWQSYSHQCHCCGHCFQAQPCVVHKEKARQWARSEVGTGGV